LRYTARMSTPTGTTRKVSVILVGTAFKRLGHAAVDEDTDKASLSRKAILTYLELREVLPQLRRRAALNGKSLPALLADFLKATN
jgi:hypothetical protein